MLLKILLSITFALSLVLSSCPAWASDQKLDFERARLLLDRGEILSLSAIMEKTSAKFPGKILEIELEEKDNLIIYEIEFLGEDGVVMEMIIQAKNGEILSVKKD